MERVLTQEEARAWGRECLQKNLQAYLRMHHMLMLAYPGKTVLIESERFIAVYDSYDDAIEAGYREFSVGPFFVHVVEPLDSAPPVFVESQYWPRGVEFEAEIAHLPLDHKYAGRIINYPAGGLHWE